MHSFVLSYFAFFFFNIPTHIKSWWSLKISLSVVSSSLVWIYHTLLNQSIVAGHLSYVIFCYFKPCCHNFVCVSFCICRLVSVGVILRHRITGQRTECTDIVLVNTARLLSKAPCKSGWASSSLWAPAAPHSLPNTLCCLQYNLSIWGNGHLWRSYCDSSEPASYFEREKFLGR